MISIESSDVISGAVPPRALGMVREWAKLRREELAADWERARRQESLEFIEPLPGLRLFLRYEEGVEGEVDVSDMAGRGVFTSWDDPEISGQVAISPETGAPTWPGEIDLCPDALYLELTGLMPSEVESRTDSKAPRL